MGSVFKYPLDKYSPQQTISMPKGAQVLSCQMQFNQPVVWAFVDPHTSEYEEHEFWVIQTGSWHRDIEYMNLRFLNTVQIDDGQYVIHVFEKQQPDSAGYNV